VNYAAVALAVVLFALGLRVFRVVPVSAKAFSVTKQATAVLADGSLDDDDKENAVREASKRLLLLFLSISVRATAALSVPSLALVALDELKIVSMHDVLGLFVSWEVILLSTAAFFLILIGRR
jgi:hypothetical protein